MDSNVGINLLIFLLACCGLTQVLQYAKILDNIRPTKGFFGEMLKCSMCTGFHVGWILSLVFFDSGILFLQQPFWNGIIMGFVSSFASYVADKTVSDGGISIFLAKNRDNSGYDYDKWI